MTGSDEFAGAQTEGNKYLRNLLVLLLDASGSMATAVDGRVKMDSLREGVVAFLNEDLPEIPAIRHRGEIAIGVFWGTTLEWITPGRTSSSPFVIYDQSLRAPELSARPGTLTPMATAIEEGLAALEERKRQLDHEDISLEFKPMAFLITDGVPEPQSELLALEGTISKLRAQAFPEERKHRKLLFFVFGVTGANDALMERLAPPSYFALKDLPLRHAMKFVSKAVGRVTQARGIGRDDYMAVREEIENARQELKDAYKRWDP